MHYVKQIVKTVALCLIGLFTSCSSKQELSREKYYSMNISEKIDYLYQVFPDSNAVSRMTLALPENITKIQRGLVMPSDKFSQRVDEICEFYIEEEFNNPKTLREFDRDFGWYDKVWDMDDLYGWYWFWGIVIVAIIISALSENGATLTIVTVFYFFCGLLSLIFFVLSDPIDQEPYPSFVVIQTESKNIDINLETNNRTTSQNESIEEAIVDTVQITPITKE